MLLFVVVVVASFFEEKERNFSEKSELRKVGVGENKDFPCASFFFILNEKFLSNLKLSGGDEEYTVKMKTHNRSFFSKYSQNILQIENNCHRLGQFCVE